MTSKKENPEKTIMQVLSEIQTVVSAPKSLYNKFGNYSYRSCESILESLKPLLKKHGASVVLRDEIVMIGDRYYVKAEANLHLGISSIQSQAFAREPLNKKGNDESQITGAASSYARKYALNGLFALDDTKDADSMNNKEDAKSDDYTVPFGKFKGKKIESISIKDLSSYYDYIKEKAKLDGQPIRGEVLTFMNKIESIIKK